MTIKLIFYYDFNSWDGSRIFPYRLYLYKPLQNIKPIPTSQNNNSCIPPSQKKFYTFSRNPPQKLYLT